MIKFNFHTYPQAREPNNADDPVHCKYTIAPLNLKCSRFEIFFILILQQYK
jgi:hypothetical protein